MKFPKSIKHFSTITLASLVATFFVLGFLLWSDSFPVIPPEVADAFEAISFLLAYLFLVSWGEQLKQPHSLGIIKFAGGSLSIYLISHITPKSVPVAIALMLLFAILLFWVISGVITLIHSVVIRWSSKESDSVAKIESIVVILTSIPMSLFACLQPFFP